MYIYNNEKIFDHCNFDQELFYIFLSDSAQWPGSLWMDNNKCDDICSLVILCLYKQVEKWRSPYCGTYCYEHMRIDRIQCNNTKSFE